MNSDDKQKFAGLMYGLGDYYGKPVSKGVLALWWESMKIHEFDEVARAASRHMEDPDAGQFMPKIADIKRHLNGSKSSQAMVAWSKVEIAIKRVGPWQTVVFDDPIIHRVLDEMGGWIDLCQKSEHDLEFKMHEFAKRYQGYLLQGGVSEFPKSLIGHTEATNNRNGHDTKEPPVLIGSQKKAALVYANGRKSFSGLIHKGVDVAAKVAALIENKKSEGAA